MIKKCAPDQKHLTLDERKIIQKGIESRCNKINIARNIGEDATTVAKEIRKHRQFKPRNIFIYPIDCIYIKNCRKNCIGKCDKYEQMKCSKRDRSPGACNQCPTTQTCRLNKYFYSAVKANEEYRRDLIDCREGIIIH